MTKVAFIFPGQGSQSPGMGRELAEAFPAARRVFDEADAALGFPISKLCFEGPAEDLQLTANTQPAILAVSAAAAAVLSEKGIKPDFVAGHSLGEYSAYVAAGALDLADAVQLVRKRGTYMQEAVPVGQGAMAALIGVGLDVAVKLAAAAAEGDVCQAANDNEPGQVVISGSKAAIDRAIALSKDYGVRRALPLKVSAPFHCALMQPAAVAMQKALADIQASAPCVPVVANVLASAISEPGEIKARLVEQVAGTVRWRESVDYMAKAGVRTFVEAGAGKVLSGMARRIVADAETVTLGTPQEIEDFAKKISG